MKRSEHALANSARCRSSDLQCRCQPRRRPGLYRGLRLRSWSRRPPLIWANGSVQYFTDQGDLSPILPDAQADAFVAAAFSPWTGISSVALTRIAGRTSRRRRERQQHRSRRQRNRSPLLRTLHLQPPALQLELFTTTTGRSPTHCSAKALEAWPIASPTPSTAARTTSPPAGTSCTRSW